STRYPKATFPFLKNLLGKQFDDPVVKSYRSVFHGGPMVKDAERGTVSFQVAGDAYTVEELVAMQIAHAKRQAEIFGGESVSGAIITVPPYFNQFERQAILDAAEIANLKVIGLMNENAAVALNYAMTRTFNNTQYHVIFDSGASSTSASLVKFSNSEVKERRKTKTYLDVEVLGVGYDATLGGIDIDVALQRHLAKIFTETKGKQAKTPITDSPRSMTRLLKEANRVKMILSANQETFASVEGLHEEIDFRTKVTRADLEELAGDFLKRFTGPIEKLLSKSKVSLENITSVVLVGGSVRIPAAQAALKAIVGEDKIAMNVNMDEANVLGAGFRSASLSTQFKVREIRVKDITDTAVEVVYDTEAKDSSSTRSLRTMLFAENAPVAAKKLMNFKRTTDFDFELAYKTNKVPILRAKLSGLAAAIEKYKETSTEPPKVKGMIELSESGLVGVQEVTAMFELEAKKEDSPSLTDKVMNFFKGKKDEKKEDPKESASSSTGSSSASASPKPTEEIKDTKDNNVTKANITDASGKKILTEKVKLKFDIEHLTIRPLPSDAKIKAMERFKVMDADDAKRRAREEARNNLESFIYAGDDFLESEEVIAISTDTQREALKTLLATSQEWLYENADEAQTDDFKDKLSALKSLHTPMLHRRNEERTRPDAIEALRTALNTTRGMLTMLQETDAMAEEPALTPADITAAGKSMDDVEKWLDEKVAAQEKLDKHETPAVLTRELESRKESLDREFMRLLQKQMRQPKKTFSRKSTTTGKSAKSKATNGTTSGNGTEAANEATEGDVGAEESAENVVLEGDEAAAAEEESGSAEEAKEARHDEL
ncbi:hypothetical protein HK101_004828, partial [Irineochytrium annulatum]